MPERRPGGPTLDRLRLPVEQEQQVEILGQRPGGGAARRRADARAGRPVSAVLVLVELAGGAARPADRRGARGGRRLAKAIGGEVHAVVIAALRMRSCRRRLLPRWAAYGVTHRPSRRRRGARRLRAGGLGRGGGPGRDGGLVSRRSSPPAASAPPRCWPTSRPGSTCRWRPTSSAVQPGDRWRLTRQRWAGSLLEEAYLDGEPRLLTVAAARRSGARTGGIGRAGDRDAGRAGHHRRRPAGARRRSRRDRRSTASRSRTPRSSSAVVAGSAAPRRSRCWRSWPGCSARRSACRGS